ncbi:MAG: RelA/SpoT domain-containing protein [Chloroflexi bacterium]|nr:RelA/SpoT domain-containing protein [Chloroflexota bacterium]
MKNAEKAIEWYKENEQIYGKLADEVASIIKKYLQQNNIKVYDVIKRAKSVKRFGEKAQNYSDPINEIKDVAGIRVITYLDNDRKNVVEAIKILFTIDPENSKDYSEELGIDRIGYRGMNYVASFGKERSELPDNEQFAGRSFEIQIMSIIQHAWSELEHPSYEFKGQLPLLLERKYKLLAAILEFADSEFVTLSEKLDEYRKEIDGKLDRNELGIEIDPASLTEYCNKRFKTFIEKGLLDPKFGNSQDGSEVVKELHDFGILKLSQLDKIIPTDLQEKMVDSQYSGNFQAIIRFILIIKETEKYFEHSWGKQWPLLGYRGWVLLGKYGVDLDHLKNYIEVETEQV